MHPFYGSFRVACDCLPSYSVKDKMGRNVSYIDAYYRLSSINKLLDPNNHFATISGYGTECIMCERPFSLGYLICIDDVRSFSTSDDEKMVIDAFIKYHGKNKPLFRYVYASVYASEEACGMETVLCQTCVADKQINRVAQLHLS